MPATKIVLVTNQSGVAKGIVDPKNLDEIHRRIDQHYKALGIEICDFLSAPYLTTSDHYYRKPQPGMLREAAEAHGLDLKKVLDGRRPHERRRGWAPRRV